MKTSFKCASAPQRMQMINDYFEYVRGDLSPETSTATAKQNKSSQRKPEIPTLRGLALFLEFKSLEDLERYEHLKHFRKCLRYARLKIEAAYEQQLFTKPTGAMFALKSMGWSEKPTATKPSTETHKTLKVEMTSTGPKPASTEKEVDVLI
jgi:hypothetical protein